MRATGWAGREGYSPAGLLDGSVGSRAGVAVRDRLRTGRGLLRGSVTRSSAARVRGGTWPLTCGSWPRWLALVLAWPAARADNMRTARSGLPGSARSEGLTSQLPGLSTTDGGQGRRGCQPAGALGLGLDGWPAAVRTIGRWEGWPGGERRLAGSVASLRRSTAVQSLLGSAFCWPGAALGFVPTYLTSGRRRHALATRWESRCTNCARSWPPLLASYVTCHGAGVGPTRSHGSSRSMEPRLRRWRSSSADRQQDCKSPRRPAARLHLGTAAARPGWPGHQVTLTEDAPTAFGVLRRRQTQLGVRCGLERRRPGLHDPRGASLKLRGGSSTCGAPACRAAAAPSSAEGACARSALRRRRGGRCGPAGPRSRRTESPHLARLRHCRTPLDL